MAYPQVTVPGARTVWVDFPHLFRDPESGHDDAFLERVLEVREVVSVEIDHRVGAALVHLDTRKSRSKLALERLAARLAPPRAPTVQRTGTPYFVLQQIGSRIVYVRSPHSVQGFRRVLYAGLALTFGGLAIVGVAAPLVPTTLFVILSSYFALRGSPRLNERLLQSRLFGGILKDWYRHRGMRRSTKRKVLPVMVLVFSITFLLMDLSVNAFWMLAAISLFGFGVVLRIPAVDDEPPFAELPAGVFGQPAFG